MFPEPRERLDVMKGFAPSCYCGQSKTSPSLTTYKGCNKHLRHKLVPFPLPHRIRCKVPLKRVPFGLVHVQHGDVEGRIGDINKVSHMNYLYILYFTACLMERTWRFALPVILSNIAGGGYQAVAVLCFVSPLACFIFAPGVGRILDTVDKSLGVWSLLLLQCSSIILSGCLLLHAFKYSLSITSGPVFNLIVALQMVEKLSAVTSEVAIERDWLTQLCGKENTLALAHGNSMLRQMDLACDFIGTVSYGWIYDSVGSMGSIIYTTVIAICSTPMLYVLIFFRLSDGLSSNTVSRVRNEIECKKFSTTVNAWREYFFENPMLPSSIVIVLLYFNVALSPGGILTAFLTFKGMNGSSLAIFRGSCALMGFVGSHVGKMFIKNFGLLKSGRIALAALIATLGSSVAIFLSQLNNFNKNDETTFYLLAFSGGIVLSRIGLWIFDLVNTQLFQQYADGSRPSGVASTEMALCSLSEILMLGVAAFLSVPIDSFFTVLVGSSYSAIILGSLIFLFWSKNIEGHFNFMPVQ